MSYPPPGQPPHIPYYTPGQTPYYNPRPTSVTVLAIIGIIFGGLGVIGIPFNILGYFVDLGEIFYYGYEGVALITHVVYDGINFVLSLILLASSIVALQLDVRGRKGMILVSVGSLVLLPIGIAMFVLWNVEDITQELGEEWALLTAVGGGTCIFLLGVIYPACVLYFMTRPHVKAAFGEAPVEEWPPRIPPYQPPGQT